jgi:predicted regulator of Ras-like GTPase activity (Roadblock/LC7/MglB family)
VDHMADLVGRLHRVKNLINGCESLSVASSDGLVLATTCEDKRQGEGLAAMASYLLTSCTKGLASQRAGDCRALDFRGDRQVMMVRLDGVRAFLVAVLHPGAQAVNLDQPSLRQAMANVPNLLHAQEVDRSHRWLLQRDRTCRYPVRQGRLTIGRSSHCDIVLSSPRVAAEHALIELIGGKLQVTDLDTQHGTKVSNRPIDGPTLLEAGDKLQLPQSGGFTVVALDHEGRELGTDKAESSEQPALKGGKKKRRESV